MTSAQMLRLLAACTLLALARLPAQTPTPTPTPKPAIPALFLSDIHFNPYADPGKVAQLNAAPVSEWPAILAASPTPAQQRDQDALQSACRVGGSGLDTPNALWLSSLAALHAQAAQARFATFSGDLLAHQFDCKYKQLLPSATHADYLAFAEKTIRYVVNGLHTALPGVPIYFTLGNNDSGCADYRLDPSHDEFLALTARIVAGSLPTDLSPLDHAAVLQDFATTGSYSVRLTALPNTRLLAFDDDFLSTKYADCAGKPDRAPGDAQIVWLQAQLAAARDRHENVWVLAHIPPGVDLYTTARSRSNICAGARPTMFLSAERLAQVLARNADIVRLALFGHTHSDELRLLTPESDYAPDIAVAPPAAHGVPAKLVASITPTNGNRPTFTLAALDPATATLVDYSVIMASNLTGIGATWATEYTYSTTYHQPAFNSAALTQLIAGFRADPTAQTPASQAYLRNYYPGDMSALLQLVWPQYTCSLAHDSPNGFAACACATLKPQQP